MAENWKRFTRMIRIDWVSLPGARLTLGTDGRLVSSDEIGLEQSITVDAFQISATAVSNSEFAAFVALTG